MKNLKTYRKLFVIVTCIAFTQVGKAQIDVDCDGNVGIGSNAISTHKLYIAGDTKIEGVGAVSDLYIKDDGGYYGPSIEPSGNNACDLGDASHAFHAVYYYNLEDQSADLTFKENIRDLEDGLDKIMKLRSIKFDYKKESFYDTDLIKDPEDIAKLEEERKNKIGLIAQEVENVLPEVVKQDDSTGIYTINYTKVIPVLISAMQEQQEIIENLTAEIETLKTSTESSKAATEIGFQSEVKATSISQNQPNPFTDETVINYYLAEEVTDATLYVYDMNGTQIKSIKLYEKGQGSITIQGGELTAGMYMYSLISDGKLIGTNQMILTN